ncbi:MAG TPA: aminotransferase class III-fold pyridoxal phosphate-dependent enzyme, partial [Spirochaetota bacterium]|nr:aminotransferase class III-fold pyridoxal phosphate-dependent enzyme [Spirochaetota bacterium]
MSKSESKNKYGISHWPDTVELQKRLYHLANELPIHQIKREKLAEYMDYFEKKCAGSKKMTDRAKDLIPGGVQHNLAFNHPFPLAITKADGAYLWDIDGNRYIDFLQAGGPTLLGSNYKPVQEKVIELIRESGPVTGLFHEYELKLAELIHSHMPSIEMFRMLMSGTEACMAAARAARTFTGKKYVIKNGGAYHGWSDQFVFGMRVPGVGPLDAHGIPAGAYQFTQEVFPNDLDALEKRMEENEKDGGTAAVFLEPLGPESGTRPVLREYNQKVRELCDRFGALLVFDEVVTGFRIGLGGAQGYFNIKPDLTVFGKCIAGGYPGAGGVGGRKDVMLCYAAGIGGGPGGKRAMVGGTLSANPMSCAAGYFCI